MVIRKSNSVCMVLVYLILLVKAKNISLYLYSMFWSIAVSVYFADLAYNLLVMGGKWGYLILSTTKFLSLENELFPPPIGVCVCMCGLKNRPQFSQSLLKLSKCFFLPKNKNKSFFILQISFFWIPLFSVRRLTKHFVSVVKKALTDTKCTPGMGVRRPL